MTRRGSPVRDRLNKLQGHMSQKMVWISSLWNSPYAASFAAQLACKIAGKLCKISPVDSSEAAWNLNHTRFSLAIWMHVEPADWPSAGA